MDIGPYNDKRNVSSGGVGGDAHIAPLIGANTPAFRAASGSGANAEAILHFMPPCMTLPNVWDALQRS